MPSNPKPLVLKIRVDKKTGELKVLGAELEQVKGKAGKAATGVNQLSGALKGLIGPLMQFASVAAATAFFKESIQEALAYEQSVVRVQAGLRSLNLEWAETSKLVEELSAQMQVLTRFSDDQYLDAFNKAVKVTRDVEMAHVAVRTAMGATVATGVDLMRSIEIVNKLMRGQISGVEEAKREFGDFIHTMDSAEQALEKVQSRFDGLAESEESATKTIATFHQAWIDFKKGLGQQILPGLTDLINLLTKLVAVQAIVSNSMAFLPKLVTKFVSEGRAGVKGFFDEFVESVRESLDIVLDKERKHYDSRKKLRADFGRFELQRQRRLTEIRLRNIESEMRLALAKVGLSEDEKIAIIKEKQTEQLAVLAEAEETRIFMIGEAEERKKQIILRNALAIANIQKATMSDTRSAYEKWAAQILNINDNLAKTGMRTFDALGAGVGQSFADQILEGKKFEQSFALIWKNIRRQVIAEITAIIAKMIVLKTVQAGLGGASGLGKLLNLGGGGRIEPGSVPSTPAPAAIPLGATPAAQGLRAKGPRLVVMAEAGEGETAVPDSKAPGFAMGVAAGMQTRGKMPASAAAMPAPPLAGLDEAAVINYNFGDVVLNITADPINFNDPGTLNAMAEAFANNLMDETEQQVRMARRLVDLHTKNSDKAV